MDCTLTSRFVCSINLKIQERSFPVVHTRFDTTFVFTNCFPKDYIVSGSASCVGHGFDEWRTVTTGKDNIGDTRTTLGVWKWITCP
jgi:hypothetical protein